MSDLSMCGECGGVLAAHRCVGCDTRHSIPPLAVAIRRAHMAALMEIGGDCDCDCDDCNRSAVGVLNMPEMQAIADVLRLLGLPDICVEWVQEIGSAVCPDSWSKHDQPEYPETAS